MDEALGSIIQALRRNRLYSNTIVIFTSDVSAPSGYQISLRRVRVMPHCAEWSNTPQKRRQQPPPQGDEGLVVRGRHPGARPGPTSSGPRTATRGQEKVSSRGSQELASFQVWRRPFCLYPPASSTWRTGCRRCTRPAVAATPVATSDPPWTGWTSGRPWPRDDRRRGTTIRSLPRNHRSGEGVSNEGGAFGAEENILPTT